MSKYPCNVIEDLLPSYIDGVCSEKTNADIEEHLKECPSCNALYKSMKEELPGVSESTSSADEKKIIQKVNAKIDARDKKIKIACIAICVAIIIAALLFIFPIKKIPGKDINIDICKEELVIKPSPMVDTTKSSVNPFVPDESDGLYNSADNWSDNTLFIFPADKNLDECYFIGATIDNYPDYSFAIDSDYLKNRDVETPTLNVITVSSDYAIKTYYEEYKNDSGKLIFNLKNARTTVFGRQATNVESSIVLFSIDDIDGATIYGK